MPVTDKALDGAPDGVLRTRREGAVLVLSHNNVAARNALSPAFYA
ncbi:MAG: enoyl-CoA hydratase, partial [Acidovorax sp.]|nr:enoyl-CoA hydratase [Acidovorax sp.]